MDLDDLRRVIFMLAGCDPPLNFLQPSSILGLHLSKGHTRSNPGSERHGSFTQDRRAAEEGEHAPGLLERLWPFRRARRSFLVLEERGGFMGCGGLVNGD